MAMLTESLVSFAPRRQGTLLKTVALALQVRRQRRALASLEAHLLADIGIQAEQAQSEATRPLWDVPNTWKR